MRYLPEIPPLPVWRDFVVVGCCRRCETSVFSRSLLDGARTQPQFMFLPRTVLFKDLTCASKNRSGVVTCTISSGTFIHCVFSVLQIRGARLWTGIGGASDARRSQLIVHRGWAYILLKHRWCPSARLLFSWHTVNVSLNDSRPRAHFEQDSRTISLCFCVLVCLAWFGFWVSISVTDTLFIGMLHRVQLLVLRLPVVQNIGRAAVAGPHVYSTVVRAGANTASSSVTLADARDKR